MKSLKNFKAELLACPTVHPQASGLEFARALIAARTQAGLTQGDVAERMSIALRVVAHIECGNGTPFKGTIQRYTEALGLRF